MTHKKKSKDADLTHLMKWLQTTFLVVSNFTDSFHTKILQFVHSCYL
jgi:hypothetical protein